MPLTTSSTRHYNSSLIQQQGSSIPSRKASNSSLLATSSLRKSNLGAAIIKAEDTDFAKQYKMYGQSVLRAKPASLFRSNRNNE